MAGFLFFSCGKKGREAGNDQPVSLEGVPSAQQIVDKAIEAHGGLLLFSSVIDFDFRERHYRMTRKGGAFTYERIFTDSSGAEIRDVLDNKGFYREIDGQRQALSAKDSSAYSNSVNSVIYFAFLPYFLNDPAASRTYLGETTVGSEPYHKIKVTFRQEGGGKDFEDEFVYWFHRDRYTLDYLAYNYLVDGGGARFRKAQNVRVIDGIRFADYVNYRPLEDSRDVEVFDQLFEKGQLEELSVIETANVQVQLSK